MSEQYKILINQETLNEAQKYLQKIQNSIDHDPKHCISSLQKLVGSRMIEQMQKLAGEIDKKIDKDFILHLRLEDWMHMIINTKVPHIFSESISYTPSSIESYNNTWSIIEQNILESTIITTAVTIYDNGGYGNNSIIHKNPFEGELIFVPEPVLTKEAIKHTLSSQRIVYDGQFDEEEFIKQMKQKLLPTFLYANQQSTSENQAWITVPGISCGVFGGRFGNYFNGSKQTPKALEKAIRQLLQEHHDALLNIAGVHLDTYATESLTQGEFRENIGKIEFRGIEGQRGYNTKEGERYPKLSAPKTFDIKRKKCKLFSIVAADALSLPGNDMNTGFKCTDEGISAGGTNLPTVITGKQGKYEYKGKKYQLDTDTTVEKYVKKHKKFCLEVKGNLWIRRNNTLELLSESHLEIAQNANIVEEQKDCEEDNSSLSLPPAENSTTFQAITDDTTPLLMPTAVPSRRFQLTTKARLANKINNKCHIL